MEDYKPNSHRSKESPQSTEERKKVEKVVHGTVKTRKRSGVDRVKDVMIADDAANIKSYVVMDVLVPAVKKAISDIVTNGIEMILYGESGRGTRKSTSSTISYRDYYNQKNSDRRPAISQGTRGYLFEDVILETRGEAEDVLYRLDEAIDTYGSASVADLYDLVGLSGNYTDNKYGWTNLRNAEVVSVRDGYRLRMPKVIVL